MARKVALGRSVKEHKSLYLHSVGVWNGRITTSDLVRG